MIGNTKTFLMWCDTRAETNMKLALRQQVSKGMGFRFLRLYLKVVVYTWLSSLISLGKSTLLQNIKTFF